MEQALGKQFGKKARPSRSTRGRSKAGWDYAEATFTKQDPFHVERMNETAGKILIEGNAAAAIGCMMAGVTVVAWYPITPSSSLCESLIGYMRKYRIDKETGKATFAIVQAEDEIASLGMVIGAGWAGARAMTATAGPGISLMSEFAGLAYYAETPAVIFDVQRVGPSTGLPTRTAQGDLLSTAFLSHGDTKHILLIPSSVEECYEFAMQAFDLSERFQTPIFVMMDLDLGMNNWMSNGFEYPTKPIDRGKVLTPDILKKLGRVGPLQGRRRRRHRLSHDARRRTAGVLHARLRPQREGAVQRAAGRLRGQRRSPDPEVRDRAAATCRRRLSKRPRTRRSASSATARRTGRLPKAATSFAKRPNVNTSYLRVRAYPFNDDAREIHRRARAHLHRGAEPRRSAGHADEARAVAGALREAAQRAALQRAADRRTQRDATTSWRRKASKWPSGRRRRRPSSMTGASRNWQIGRLAD